MVNLVQQSSPIQWLDFFQKKNVTQYMSSFQIDVLEYWPTIPSIL